MIAASNLVTRWREMLATVLAVATGVGLLGAVLLTASAARPPVQERFAATSALVVGPEVAVSQTPRGDGRVPWTAAAADALAARLSATPGTVAVPDRSFPAVPLPGGRPVGDPEDRENGHGVASLVLGGHTIGSGTAPTRAGEAVVGADLGVAPGGVLPVLFADAVREVRVTGTTGAPGVRAIGVLGPVPAPPPDTTVLTGDARGSVEPVQDSRIRFRGDQLLAALGLLTGVTTVVVVSAALSTAVAGRRRELGLLRAVGATPGQVRRIVLGEAVLTGLVGAVLGAVLATALAPVLHRALVVAEAARPAVVTAEPGPLAIASVAGVLLAVAGGTAASRRAARAVALDVVVVGRTDAAGPGRPRTVAGVLTAVLGAATAVLTAGAVGDGRVGLALLTGSLLVVAAALLAPVLIGLLGARRGPAGPGPVLRSPTVTLVRAELAAAPGRAAAVAAPTIVAVGFAVLIGGLVATTAVAYPAERTAVLAGSVAVEQDGAPGLPDTAARALDVPGARLPLPTVLVVPGPSGPTALDAVGTGDAGLVRPGTVVLSGPVAAGLGLRGGDTLPARFPDGETVELAVARVLPPDERRGDVALARADVRSHDPGALTDTAFLPAGAVPPEPPPGVVVRDARAYALAEYAVDARLSGALAALLVAVSAGYGGLAIANGIVSSVRSRRAGDAVLAAVGATRRRRVLLGTVEAAAATLAGTVLGIAVTVPPLVAVASGLARATGRPVPPVPDPVATGAAVGVCLLVAMLSAALATGRSGPRPVRLRTGSRWRLRW
ncbi:ABC transporter permease [Pseudonocardia sp. HH130630-07]|uniref:ABC transporter permease n=1 Tax=Pseudonocardia sp. HH130630-07 TaxID=1690815 RepID=UPI000814F09E|nr:ABC transporter permease [Pseudonocardia sp. HH130630-07]ANY05061.1 hypothetical protein AFB00_00515 [Pseudonocardia sp. HH130630-07]